MNVILVCKPDSHATLSKRVAFWQANDAIQELETRCWGGRGTTITRYRSLHEVLLQGGKRALGVHGLEMTSGTANTGAQLSHNSFSTNHRWRTANVAAVAHAGRGRWKIENENHTVLKTQGDHIEPNLGPGKQSLAAFLLSLDLLAFLFHTVLEWGDDKYALLRQVLARRQTFFDAMRALMRYMVFDSWQHLMDVMIQGLTLEAKFDTG